MAGKYGPADAWILVDGYNMSAARAKSMSHKTTSPMEETTALGDSWKERSPIGVLEVEVVQEGAIWNTAALNSHAALVGSGPSTPQSSVRIICLGLVVILIFNRL